MQPVVVAWLVYLWLVNRMPVAYYEVLVKIGYESCCGRISVAMPVAYLVMLSLTHLMGGLVVVGCWGSGCKNVSTYHECHGVP